MTAAPPKPDHAPGQRTQEPPRIVRLWTDKVRAEQLVRLRSLELQADKRYGRKAWELAEEVVRNLPSWARVDLPSPDKLAAILGVFRTGATLKTGKLLRLEVSAKDIADLLGYSKSTVEAALRLLGVGPLVVYGEQVGRGLGLVHRGRRTAFAYLHGQLRRVYRTSRMVLTTLGRMLLGLGDLAEHRAEQKRRARERRKAEPTEFEAELHPRRREAEYIRGQGHDGGGACSELDPATDEVGLHWLRWIQQRL